MKNVQRIRYLQPAGLMRSAGYSQIVQTRADTLVFISGQAAVDGNGDIVGRGDFDAQAAQVFRNLGLALKGAGCSASDLVKMTVLLRNIQDISAYRVARDRFFSSVEGTPAPAVTLFGGPNLYEADFLIEIEAVAAKADENHANQ